MKPEPSNEREAQRLQVLAELNRLNAWDAPEFQALVRSAALMCQTPMALVSLVEAETVRFMARLGMDDDAHELPREGSFCTWTIEQQEPLIVPDARLDPRFADSALVTGEAGIRFYAGIALRLLDGQAVGTLCVLDRQPRVLDDTQIEALQLLASAVVQGLEGRRLAQQAALSESRLRAFSDSAPVGVFAADAQGLHRYTNGRWQQIFGLDAAQALALGWLRGVHPEDREAVLDEWQRAATQGADFDMRFRVLQPGGAVRRVRSVARRLDVPTGSLSSHVGSVDDITAHEDALQALHQERQRLASIIQATGAGIWEWNLATGETRFNPRWADILGHSPQDLAGMNLQTWMARIHPEDAPRSQAAVMQHLRGESPHFEVEVRVRHVQGHWLWIADRGQLQTRTPDGRPEWMFGTARDITERRQQEEALRKSEGLLKRIGGLAAIGAWEYDIATGQLNWSDETCRLHGVPPGHPITPEEAASHMLPQYRELIPLHNRRAVLERRAWEVEVELTPQAGRPRWLRVVGRAEFEGERAVRLLGAVQDITDRVLQRQALQAAHERIALANDSGGIGVWESDLVSRTVHWDERMFGLYGLPVQTDHVSPDDWPPLLHPEDRARAVQAVQDAVDGRADYDCEFRTVWPDGSIHHLRGTARARRDATGRALSLVGVNWDVTRLRQLGDELAAQHELLRITLQSIADAVITTDAAGAIQWLNPVAERMTGWASADARGRPWTAVFRLVDELTRQPGRPVPGPVDRHRPQPARPADRPGRPRVRHRGLRRPDPQRRRRAARHGAGVPGCDRAAPHVRRDEVPRHPRPADRAGQSQRVRAAPAARPAQRGRRVRRACADVHRPRSVQARQRRLRPRRGRPAAASGGRPAGRRHPHPRYPGAARRR